MSGGGGAQWDDYYPGASLHSSTGGFSADARHRIARRWTRLFESVPSGGRVLDVGTGTGALLALASTTTGADHRLELTGVDRAAVRPDVAPRSSAHCEIRYRGGVDASSLPFEDRHFDLVCSQFGIEYAGLESAVQEAARVSSMELVALVHAVDGVVVRQNGLVAGQIDWVLDELGLIQAISDHLVAAGEGSAARLKSIAGAIGEACQRLENPTFLKGLAGHVGQFMAGPAEGVSDALIDLESRLRDHADRMRALTAAACDPTVLDAVTRCLEEAGFDRAEWSPLRSDQGRHLVGYWLQARR